MIREHKGRKWSERTEDENDELLRAEIEALSPEERALLQATLTEVSEGNTDILDFSTEHQYKWEPVSMEQFIDDEYYLGLSTMTLYPKIKDDLILLDEMKAVREVILTGSIGYGKTTYGSIAICRQLYLLSCLRSPQLAFGLSPGSEMVIASISKSLHLARTVLKSAIEDKIKLSPYFDEYFKPKVGRDVTQFPSNIQLSIGSCNSERVLGMNVFGGVMDEANFMATKGQQISITGSGKKTVAQYDMAEKVYAGLVRRIKSRFQRAGGNLPGMMVLLSSANVMGSFTDRKIEESKDDPTVFIRNYAVWDVKPKDHFSGETFCVVVGSSSLRSRLVPKEEEEGLNEEQLEAEGAFVLRVPIEYWEDFDRDLEGAIRDIAGMSTHAISAFLHRIESVEWARRETMKHPFTVKEYVYGEPGQFIWDLIVQKAVRRLPGGYTEDYWKPKRNPGSLRWVHVDTSLSGDCTGIAMGHIERYVEVVRRSEEGDEYNDVAPHFVMDFMLRVIPPPGEQIYLPDIRRLVYELQDHGYMMMGFSCDRYQSAEMLQQMKRRGVHSELISVDMTTDPYEALKAALYEKRIEYYEYAPFEKEVKALEYDRLKGKIDHPQAGSKDVSDAVAGVIQGLILGAKRIPVAPSRTPEEAAAARENDMAWVSPGNMIPVGPDFDVERVKDEYGDPNDPFGGKGGLFPLGG